MAQDFIELFEHLNQNDVQEYKLYEFIEETDALIRADVRNAVPNTLRKFFECLLLRCEEIVVDFKMIRYDEEEDHINICGSAKRLFKKSHQKFYNETIRPFLKSVNSGSHYNGIDYADITNSDLRSYIGYIVEIWNWYAKNVRELGKQYMITKSYGLPKSDKNEMINIKNKLASQIEKIQKLEDENKQIKETEEFVMDMDVLADNIYRAIKKFNEEHLYCTHRTIALFLLGDRIAQTDFAGLSQSELFGKYAKTKFSEFEYDLAIDRLIQEERIFQSDMYFIIFDKETNALKKWFIRLKAKFNLIKINKQEYQKTINKKYLEILQKAINDKKTVKLKYLKAIPNTNKKEVSTKVLIPKILLPKDKMNEEYDLNNPPIYTQNLYYLRAFDTKKNEERTYRLDSIKNPKII